MNGPNGDLENCRGVHKPTVTDIKAVKTYWDANALSSLRLSQSNPGTLVATWKDTSWSDAWQQTVLFYWDWNTSSWVHLQDKLYNTGIGFHNDALPSDKKRTMKREWDVSVHGWPFGTWYIGRADSWSWPYRRWEYGAYGNMVYMASDSGGWIFE